MTADKWIDIFKFGGTAIVVLAALFWSLVKLFQWAGRQVEWTKDKALPIVERVVSKHTDTLDTVKAFCETLDSRLASNNCPGSTSLVDHARRIEEMHGDVKVIKRVVVGKNGEMGS